eukprot:NODE_409_length_9212_cov_0.585537.p10 type:complete len:128 gc:universal NODE_409_length_9212_cov_0.585537:8764-9147(+)
MKFSFNASKLNTFMKYCSDPHAIYAKYEVCTNKDQKSLLYLLYQFFTDLERMSDYLSLEIPLPILHIIVQFLKTDAIYVQKHSKNVHIYPYLASLDPLLVRKFKSFENNSNKKDLRISLQYKEIDSN